MSELAVRRLGLDRKRQPATPTLGQILRGEILRGA